MGRGLLNMVSQFTVIGWASLGGARMEWTWLIWALQSWAGLGSARVFSAGLGSTGTG